jgi:DNA-binding Lrp family transcriptional regulator
MESNLDAVDIELLREAQNGIPLVAEPFKGIAENLNIDEEEVLQRLKRLGERKVLRRFAASIDNRKVGVVANAMVTWKVPQERIEEVGGLFAGNEKVTHCYIRSTVPGRWTYNLYTVLHGHDKASVENLAKEMSSQIGIDDYLLLFSTRVFKKTSNGRIIPEGINNVKGS